MHKIFVTRQIPESGIKLLKRKKNFKVTVSPHDRVLKRKELLKNVVGIDALLCLLTDKIDAEIMDAAGPQLKVIANYAVGFDNIDLKAAAERGIMVTNTPGPEISESVAEHALALIFALSRRIVEADDFTRAGKYKGWSPMLLLGNDVFGKTLGIVGLGRIGKALTERMAQGFNVKIQYFDIKRDPQFEKKFKAKYVTLDKLLKTSDLISLHVPLLPSTRHLISTKQLKMMKKTAYLVNTSRGPVVNELALTKALVKGEIAGAGLDVFECEPLTDCNPKDQLELRKMDNAILTPHIASATIGTRSAMSDRAAKNIIASLAGKRPPNLLKKR